MSNFFNSRLQSFRCAFSGMDYVLKTQKKCLDPCGRNHCCAVIKLVAETIDPKLGCHHSYDRFCLGSRMF